MCVGKKGLDLDHVMYVWEDARVVVIDSTSTTSSLSIVLHHVACCKPAIRSTWSIQLRISHGTYGFVPKILIRWTMNTRWKTAKKVKMLLLQQQYSLSTSHQPIVVIFGRATVATTEQRDESFLPSSSSSASPSMSPSSTPSRSPSIHLPHPPFLQHPPCVHLQPSPVHPLLDKMLQQHSQSSLTLFLWKGYVCWSRDRVFPWSQTLGALCHWIWQIHRQVLSLAFHQASMFHKPLNSRSQFLASLSLISLLLPGISSLRRGPAAEVYIWLGLNLMPIKVFQAFSRQYHYFIVKNEKSSKYKITWWWLLQPKDSWHVIVCRMLPKTGFPELK